MSTPKSMFEHILEKDENVKRWKNQVIETENLIKSMQNELEVEQAKENLLLTEMRGKILQVDRLTLCSSQQASEKLQDLMVEQLAEINKSEILVKVDEENYKQCASSLQEISRWKLRVPELLVTGSHIDQERESEIRLSDMDAGQDELKDERKTIEEDISKIEEAIAESEKEHAVLKEFLTEHQKLLTEIESGAKMQIPQSRKSLCNNEGYTKASHDKTANIRQIQDPSVYQRDWNMGFSTSMAAPSSLVPASSSRTSGPKIQNHTLAAPSALVPAPSSTMPGPKIQNHTLSAPSPTMPGPTIQDRTLAAPYGLVPAPSSTMSGTTIQDRTLAAPSGLVPAPSSTMPGPTIQKRTLAAPPVLVPAPSSTMPRPEIQNRTLSAPSGLVPALSSTMPGPTIQDRTLAAPSGLVPAPSSTMPGPRIQNHTLAVPSALVSAPICTMPGPKIQNRTFEAKTAIISKKTEKVEYPTHHQKEESNEGFGIGSRTAESRESTSEMEKSPTLKKARLNLYDAPGLNQPTALAQIKSQVPQTKFITTFKPKIPSTLRNRIN